jgi:hypothetical protein
MVLSRPEGFSFLTSCWAWCNLCQQLHNRRACSTGQIQPWPAPAWERRHLRCCRTHRGHCSQYCQTSSRKPSSWAGLMPPADHRPAPALPSPCAAGACGMPTTCPLMLPGCGCRRCPVCRAAYAASEAAAEGKGTGRLVGSPCPKGTLTASRPGAGRACKSEPSDWLRDPEGGQVQLAAWGEAVQLEPPTESAGAGNGCCQ